MHTVTVTVSFPVSEPKAIEVLERWWKYKTERKLYMRERRSGKKVSPS